MNLYCSHQVGLSDAMVLPHRMHFTVAPSELLLVKGKRFLCSDQLKVTVKEPTGVKKSPEHTAALPHHTSRSAVGHKDLRGRRLLSAQASSGTGVKFCIPATSRRLHFFFSVHGTPVLPGLHSIKRPFVGLARAFNLLT